MLAYTDQLHLFYLLKKWLSLLLKWAMFIINFKNAKKIQRKKKFTPTFHNLRISIRQIKFHAALINLKFSQLYGVV